MVMAVVMRETAHGDGPIEAYGEQIQSSAVQPVGQAKLEMVANQTCDDKRG